MHIATALARLIQSFEAYFPKRLIFLAKFELVLAKTSELCQKRPRFGVIVVNYWLAQSLIEFDQARLDLVSKTNYCFINGGCFCHFCCCFIAIGCCWILSNQGAGNFY